MTSYLVSTLRADTVGCLPMHSASSRTSYSRESASKRTAAKALSPTRPVCLFALRGYRRNAVGSHSSRKRLAIWFPPDPACQMESLVPQGYSWDRWLSVHNCSPVRSIMLMAVHQVGKQGSGRNLGHAPSRHCDGAWHFPRHRCSRQSCASEH